MRIEFDPAKDAINRQKHGVSLAFGELIWSDPDVFLVTTFRASDAEDRWKAVGMVAERLWTAVHVPRGRAVRIISVRRSNDAEQRAYHRHPR